MKILHVISSANPNFGGPIEGVRQLHYPVKVRGNETHILCGDQPDSEWLGSLGFSKIFAVGAFPGRYGFSFQMLKWLKSNADAYDIIVVNGIWQFHSLAVNWALRDKSVPYVVFTHGMLDPWFKKRYPLKHLKKWLYWPWGDYRVLRDASAVIFTCEEERLLARRSFWLYKAKEFVSLYGTSRPAVPSELAKREFFLKFPECQGKKIILFMGRIHEKKGCDLLIQAFSQVANLDADLHLMIAGPDLHGLGVQLQKIANSFGIANRITWAGMLQGDMKWSAFCSSFVFCLPSHQENFGIVVAEALACGLPVIISNKVNIWREIQSDQAGFICEDTATDVEVALIDYLNLSEAQIEVMRNKAIKCYENRFSIDKVADCLLSKFHDIIQ